MELVLNVWQRQMFAMIVGNTRGNVAAMRKALKILDVLELPEADRKELNFRALPDGNLVWNDDGRTYELEVPEEDFLKAAFVAFDQWPAGNAALVIDIEDQLGLEEAV